MLKMKLENYAAELNGWERKVKKRRLKGMKWKWGHIYDHVKQFVNVIWEIPEYGESDWEKKEWGNR
jgi:hypothetical protein